ncbi:hypothetical protein WDU94_006630 [Cyamophila willieti]
MNEMEQKEYNNQVEIVGVKNKDINAEQVVGKILEKAGFNPGEIQHKVKKTTTKAGEGRLEKTTVHISFRSQEDRNRVLTKIKKDKVYTKLENIVNADSSPVSINESLCPYYKKLFFEAKRIKREKNYSFLWTRDGRILLKKTVDGNAIRLSCMDDLMLHINIRSLKLNWDLLLVKIRTVLPKLDLLILTEVNVKSEEALAYQLRNFIQICKCRIRRKGGGVMVFCKDEWDVQDLKYNLDEAENFNLRITHIERKLKFVILAIYRPPKCKLDRFINDLNFWLQNAIQRNEHLILVGDINVCIMNRTSINTPYLNTLYDNSLIPSISKPTREELLDGVPTVSCIDHINYRLNRREHSATSTVINDKIADHYFTAVTIQRKQPDMDTIRQRVPTMIEITDNRECQRKILAVDWETLKQINDPVVLHETVVSQFNLIYEESKKSIQIKENKYAAPWVNEKIRTELRKKKELLKMWQNCKSNLILYEDYKRQRNITTNVLKKEKRIFIFKLFQEAQGDMLKTWRLINDLMNRKIKEPVEIKLQRHFQTQDVKSLANQFNKNFIEQVKEIKLKNEGPVLDVQMNNYQMQGTMTTMYLRKATEKDIFQILKKMKKTGKGYDGIRNRDIVDNRLILTPLVTHLVNIMIEKAIIPQQLKTSCVTPLFKQKGKPDSMSQYRPVGSLPIVEKVLEKYLNIQTQKYLETNSIIPNFQHGFQRGKSTITLLQEFSDQINTALDERKSVVVLLLDLTFAFDTLDHGLLKKKFNDIGMTHPIFPEYLHNRRQVTRIGEVSEEEPVNQGLCQGGINSPTWYNIYTYDVKHVRRTGTLRMFADDSCIVAIHKDVNAAAAIAQQDFINLQKYLYNNHIYLNEKKTEALVMGFMSRTTTVKKIQCHSRLCLANKTYETQCQCQHIEYKDESKYLGIIIDSEFKMKKHVYNLCSKLRILKYKLDQINAGSLPMTTKVTIYFSLIDSLLRYGVTLYNYAPQYALQPLNAQQRKIRNILFNQSNISCLTPEELSTFVLIYTNFHNQNFRQVIEHPYNLRVQRYRRPHVYTIRYGDRRLEYVIPTLLNQYCQQFLEEDNKLVLKIKLKESILAQRNVR